MILVTLGTQDKNFTRLLQAIQLQIDNKIINEEVIVQAGCTKFNSNDMKIFDLIPMDQFDDLVKKCNLLITHGGVGSIIAGLKNDKKVIACARLAKHKEHTNDHQLQIVDNFYHEKYILKYDEKDDFAYILKQSKTFEPLKYKSNTNNMVKTVKDYIDKH